MIVSGGQTGVDRAALDVALRLGLPCGGWCPRGRRAADGRVPDRYPLRETPSSDYRQRTRWNVRDSEATLIVTRGGCAGGTELTVQAAARLGRPAFVVDLDSPADPKVVSAWLADRRVTVLNVAGPREEEKPGIGVEAAAYLGAVFSEAKA